MDAWLHYGVPNAGTADEIIAWARANSFEVRHSQGSRRVDVGITVRDPEDLHLCLAWRGDPVSWLASAEHLAEPSNALLSLETWNGPLLLQMANDAAARALLAWLNVGGLAAEVEEVRIRADGDAVSTPGLDDVRTNAEEAARGACDAADTASSLVEQLLLIRTNPAEAAAVSEDAASAMRAYERVQRAAYAAERASRDLAQLAFGVSAHVESNDRVERLDRAAVAVLQPPPGQRGGRDLLSDGLRLRARHRPELVTELAGIVCRVLVDRVARVVLTTPSGRVEMWVDPRDALQVTSDPPAFGGEAERAWRRPSRPSNLPRSSPGCLSTPTVSTSWRD